MTRRKLFWAILIFVLYAVLAWIVAGLLAPPTSFVLDGLILTVCGFAVLVVYILIARFSASPGGKSSEPAQNRPSAPEAVSGPPTVSPVRDLIREANARLGASPTLASQRVRSTIADFPLYLVMGSEGSGKTSLFLASKYEPELLAGQVHRESAVVPTQLGNIWFADSSVIVEPAGGLYSGDPSQWSDFIASFRRPRGKSRLARVFGEDAEAKLGGVLFCFDVSGFVGVPDSTRLAAMARLAQQRLRAVGESFGHDFPVFLIFTKSDNIPCFKDYFGRLPQTEDQQVFGYALPAQSVPSEISDNVATGLNRLFVSLADKRLAFLRREENTAKRPGIYEFPREFKKLRGPVVQFLADVFRPNPLQPNPRLGGVFFTGTRKVVGQQVTGLDKTVVIRVGDVTRVLRAEEVQKLRSQALNSHEPEPEVTRWSFAADLWKQILESRPVAGTGPRINQRQWRYRKLAFISAVTISCLAMLLFVISCMRNFTLVTDVRAAALRPEAVGSGLVPSPRNLQDVDDLRYRLASLIENRPGMFMRLGFYEGNRLRDPAWRLYWNRFREYFLNPIITRLESQLSSLPLERSQSNQYDEVHSDLQVYRTVTRSPEAACKADATLGGRLLALWRDGRQVDGDSMQIAKDNFQFFAESLRANRIPEELSIASKDDTVVQPARRYLRNFKGAEPQYNAIIDQLNRSIPPVRLSDLLRDDKYRSAIIVADEVPGAFTRAGWDRAQQLIDGSGRGGSADSCVLGNTGNLVSSIAADATRKTEIQRLYVAEYIRRWKEFLDSARVLPYSGCADGARKLGILKDNKSPLLAVLWMVSANTTFPKHQRSVAENMKAAANDARKASRWSILRPKASEIPENSKVGSMLAEGPSEDDISAAFQPTHAVFETSPLNPDRWQDGRNLAYLNSLGQLQRDSDALDHGGKCDEGNQPGYEKANTDLAAAEGVLDALVRNFESRESYSQAKTLLEAPLAAAKRLFTPPDKVGGAKQAFCTAYSPLRNKYPFNSKGEDASLNEFDRVFNPSNGPLADLRKDLGAYLVKSDGTWTQKPDSPVKLPPDVLALYNKVSAISDALFPRPMKYGLTVQPNPVVKQVTGTLNGEPISRGEFVWPGTRPEIDLRAELSGGGSTAVRFYSSVWGIFQLVGEAEHHASGTRQFQLIHVGGNVGGGQRSHPQTILEDGSPIVFEVTQFPNGVVHAFDKDFFAVPCSR